jgi:chromatin segregation and condensation protein Rec8/ScpA/Scc1 (kleisin family)
MDLRSYKMREYVKSLLEQQPDEGQIAFTDMVRGCSKPTVVRAFFQVLVLASNEFVSVDQVGPFGPIKVKAGINM